MPLEIEDRVHILFSHLLGKVEKMKKQSYVVRILAWFYDSMVYGLSDEGLLSLEGNVLMEAV